MRRALTLLFCVLPLLLFVAPPEPADASVITLSRMEGKSNKQAHDSCITFEVMWQHAFRCEGWDPGTCRRRSLTRPNNVICFPNFFASGLGRTHVNCARVQEWFAKNGGTPHKVGVRKGSATTPWDCHMHHGGEPT